MPKGGNPPTHVCTFDFLDDSIETDWETFRSKPDLYGSEAIAGCVNRDPITDNNNSQTGTTNM